MVRAKLKLLSSLQSIALEDAAGSASRNAFVLNPRRATKVPAIIIHIELTATDAATLCLASTIANVLLPADCGRTRIVVKSF